MMNIQIRKGEPGDIEVLVTFLYHLFVIEKDFTIDADTHRAGLRLLFAEPHTRTIIVAEADDVIVGMVTAQIVVSTAVGGYSILLEDMYVDSGFRRKGVGSKLLEQVLVWGAERGARRVHLVADRANTRALGFYRQAGLMKSRMTALYGKLDTIAPHMA
jgi:GNAT superfamily N-acetyltransferase